MMEAADEHVNMESNVWLRILRYIGVVVYYLVYPIILLLCSLLSLLLSLLGTVLAPFVYVGRVVLYVIGAPFRFLAKFEPLYYFLVYAVLIGGIAGILLCVTYRFIGRVFNLSSNTESESPKFKRSYSADVTPERDESSDSAASEARGSKPRNQQSDSKRNNRFTLGEFYADWMDQDDLIPSKEPGIISSTIIEEEDDNQEAWE